jgi:S1-C subfamily serine protease
MKFTMNSKQLLLTLGLGALTVGLVALPGSSARKPESSGAAAQKHSHAEHVSAAMQQVDESPGALDDLDLAALPSFDGDEDVQVMVNSGQAWLGVSISEVTGEKVKDLKLPAERGVYLGKIVPESPAAKAGLKENDVITEINGQRIEGTEQFRRMIREIPVGRTAQFTVWRDGHSQTISVTLGKSEGHHAGPFVAPVAPGAFTIHMPDMPQMGELFENGLWHSTRPRLGIDAEDVGGEFGNFFGAPEGEGILVRGIIPESPAAKAGLKVGDVITSVDGERIRSIGELREKLVEKKEAKNVKLGLIRNKAALSLSVELPAPVEHKEHHEALRTNI